MTHSASLEGKKGSAEGHERPGTTRRRYLGVATALAACGGATGVATSQPKLVKGPVQITWTFWATPDNIAFFQEMASSFQTAFPEVRVQQTQITGVYDEAILAMVTGGTPPDAMETGRPAATGWAVKGISTSLDPYLCARGVQGVGLLSDCYLAVEAQRQAVRLAARSG